MARNIINRYKGESMLHEITLFGEIDKVAISIQRIKDAYEISKSQNKGALYVAFSGGKDSICVAKLCEMAGVPYELHYNATTVDPPELIHFIKDNYKNVIFEKPRYSMWQLIVRKHMPPTRLVRYCCQELKEKGGENRVCCTGVRKYESLKRSGRKAFETIGNKKERMLFDDNGEFRNALEQCTIKAKIVCNPIIDWYDEDVWQFIRENKMPYCKLYDKGYTRIGCIGCPMSTERERELNEHPFYKQKYIEAFDKMVKSYEIRNKDWKDGQDVYNWWLNDNREKQIDGQMEMELNKGERIMERLTSEQVDGIIKCSPTAIKTSETYQQVFEELGTYKKLEERNKMSVEDMDKLLNLLKEKKVDLQELSDYIGEEINDGLVRYYNTHIVDGTMEDLTLEEMQLIVDWLKGE